MLTGVFFLAMPLTIVGTSFNSAWEELEHSKHEVEEEENKDKHKKSHVKLSKHAMEFRCAMHCLPASWPPSLLLRPSKRNGLLPLSLGL